MNAHRVYPREIIIILGRLSDGNVYMRNIVDPDNYYYLNFQPT